MFAFIKKLRTFAAAHKVVATAFVLLLGTGAYYGYKGATAAPAVTKYVIQKATKGSVVSSISGSGQVEPVTSIDIKPTVSENVTKIYVKVGDRVTAGQLLVQLDATNEVKAVKQAQLSLQSAQLNLAKIQEVTTSTLLQSQNSVRVDQQNIVDASTTLMKDYVSGFNGLGGTFVNFQNVMIGLENFAGENTINKLQDNPDAYVSLLPTYLQNGASTYRASVQSTYQDAAKAYQAVLNTYHAANQNSDTVTLDALFQQTYSAAKTISDAVKASKDLLNYVVNNYPASSSTSPLPSVTNTFQTNLSSYTNTINSEVTGVGNTITGIVNDRTSIVNAQSALQQANESLSELLAGPSQTDLLSQQISIQNAQNSLDNANQDLAATSVRAPIDGVVSAIGATIGSTVASSAATIVGNGQDAAITLNEVDAAKVSVGQRATLSFDAIDGLSLAGQVIQIDPVGTVSQGVVNYSVKVGFTDTSSSSQVKAGMSVTADIVTDVHQDVIAVPNAAVKTIGGTKYVLEPSTAVDDSVISASANGGVILDAAPKMVPVTVGASNDSVTEITSGINEGDQIIVQSIASSGSTATTATGGTNALRLLGGGATGGGGGFTGGNVRVAFQHSGIRSLEFT